jgi:hypothetical protein
MHRIPAKRAVTGLIASLLVIGAALAAGVASHVRTASATPPTPPFTQCPPVGLDTSCAVLIVFNPDGSRTTLVDPTQPPFDGIEDTLVGVQNNSSTPVSSLSLTGPGIFGFDGDGLCAQSNAPGGCPFDSTLYAGRSSTTSTAVTTAGCGNTFTITDMVTFSSGTVNWPLCAGISSGGSAYFSLEGPTAVVAPPTAPIVTFVTLSPVAAVNPVSTPTHTVTALVQDQFMMPMSGVTVTFTVTRTPPPSPASGTCTTGTSGTCTFTYAGPILPAIDAITGCAAGAGGLPVCGAATKTWVLPVGTASCAIDITNGGSMIANNGDKVTFGGNVHTDQAAAPSGQEQYTDSPANLDVHSINILAVTCTTNQEQADIFGAATINGSGSHVFRIEVTDPDSTSGSDTYSIVLDTGYNSGSHAIKGNVEMHHT